MSEEEIESTEEIIEETKKDDPRLQKSVELLIKQTNIDEEKLAGLSLEDKFDRLSFLYDNMPKQSKSRNKPVVPLPINTNEPIIGRKMKDVGGKDFYLFKPSEWIKQKNK
jgi:hypothetical protein